MRRAELPLRLTPPGFDSQRIRERVVARYGECVLLALHPFECTACVTTFMSVSTTKTPS